MTDDAGMRKLGRRRRTTRRLMRRSIRVPGDDVPRQNVPSAETPFDESEVDEDAELVSELDAQQESAEGSAPAVLQVRPATHALHSGGLDGAPSGVMQAPPPRSPMRSELPPPPPPSGPAAPPSAPLTGSAYPSLTAASNPALAAAPLPDLTVRTPYPHLPPTAAEPGNEIRPQSGELALALASALEQSASQIPAAVVPSAATSGHATAAGEDDAEDVDADAVDTLPPTPKDADEPTNPQIRLSETGQRARRSSRPPSMRPEEQDEPTHPRIEITREMALAAGRVTTLDLEPVSAEDPVRAEDNDSDTNPRARVEPEEESSLRVFDGESLREVPPAPRAVSPVPRASSDAPGRASVVVGRSVVIGVAAPESYVDTPSIIISPEALIPQEPDEIETLDIDDSDDVTGKLDLDGTRDIAGRSSKAPPPPPIDPLTGKPVAKKVPAVPSAAGKPPPPPPAAPKKAAPQKAPKRRSWWEDFFSDDYLHSVHRPPAGQISKQVDFIETSLGLQKGAAVLDVGCGLGLQSLELARRGYLVVGLDLSLPMITRAAEDAQHAGLPINFMHSDMRELAFEGTFDAVICVGTTFGFFDDDTNRDVLARMGRALKPNGRLLLDVVNRDHVIGSQPNLVWFEGDGCVVMEESDFNYFTSRLTVKRTMMREDGRQSEAEYAIRMYALHELGTMLQQTAFRVTELSGQEATRGVFFGSYSARILLLAERRPKTDPT